MIVWFLLSACAAYFLSSEPHIAAGRKRLAERWSFYRELIRCPPCCFGWGGAFSAAFLHSHLFVPAWLCSRAEWYVVDALDPLLAAAVAIGGGYILLVLSPLTAMGARRSDGEPKQEGAPRSPAS